VPSAAFAAKIKSTTLTIPVCWIEFSSDIMASVKLLVRHANHYVFKWPIFIFFLSSGQYFIIHPSYIKHSQLHPSPGSLFLGHLGIFWAQ